MELGKELEWSIRSQVSIILIFFFPSNITVYYWGGIWIRNIKILQMKVNAALFCVFCVFIVFFFFFLSLLNWKRNPNPGYPSEVEGLSEVNIVYVDAGRQHSAAIDDQGRVSTFH